MTRIAFAIALLAALAVGYFTVPCNAAPAGGAKHAPEIVMYVMPNCGYCVAARAYLKQHDLAWREIDVTTSEAGAAEFAKRGGQGTPLFVIDGKTVHGFNAQRMDQVLAAQP
jgi:glutaredoxin